MFSDLDKEFIELKERVEELEHEVNRLDLLAQLLAKMYLQEKIGK